MPEAKLCLKSYQPQVDTHQHPFHQLVLPVKGYLDIQIGHNNGIVSNAQAAVICASSDHAFEAQGDNQFIVADIPTSIAPAFDQLPVFLALDESLHRYIQFLQTQIAQPSFGDNHLMQRQMLILLVQLLDEKKPQHSPFSDKRITRARLYLERHFPEKQALNNAALQAGISSRQLRQLFAQCYNISPSQYLLELRMQSAWQMLINSQYSIEWIAEHCGYTSVSAFSDRFHKHFNHSPSQMRRFNK